MCPGRITPGRSISALVELVDVVPTVLDYLGMPVDRPAPAARPVRSNLQPLVERRIERLRDAVFSEYRHTEEAMARTARYKLIYRTAAARTDWYKPVERPQGRGLRLCDLAADPEELHDLSPDPRHAAAVEALTTRLAEWYPRYLPRGRSCPPDLPVFDFLDRAIALP